ncbi:MAG: hypothetical protein ACLRTQ_11700 [Candidatus Borkfalkia sp.]
MELPRWSSRTPKPCEGARSQEREHARGRRHGAPAQQRQPNIPTGKIEVVPDSVEVLGLCTENLPFEIEKSLEVSEDMRFPTAF